MVVYFYTALDSCLKPLPVKYGYKDVVIKGYVNKVVIACSIETIASHSRSYEKGEKIYDPLHYLPLIERKIARFIQAAPLKKLVLPECFELLLRRLENNHGIKNGRRGFKHNNGIRLNNVLR
jgi:hypothetical protein